MARPYTIYFVEAHDRTKNDNKWFLWPDSEFLNLPTAERKIQEHLDGLEDKNRYQFRVVPYTRQNAIYDSNKVSLTDYVPYMWDENLSLRSSDFLVSDDLLPVLEKLHRAGIRLTYDRAKTQGLEIRSMTNLLLGHVIVGYPIHFHDWLTELTKKLVELAANL
jgi:hypothetical protein